MDLECKLFSMNQKCDVAIGKQATIEMKYHDHSIKAGLHYSDVKWSEVQPIIL